MFWFSVFLVGRHVRNLPSLEPFQSTGMITKQVRTNMFCHVNEGFQVLEKAHVYQDVRWKSAWHVTTRGPGDMEVLPPILS